MFGPGEDRLGESEVKLIIGDWLTGQGLEVFDERRNRKRPHWGVFKVRSIERGRKPDLLVRGTLSATKISQPAYLAVELKCGYKHRDILDGFDAILQYFSDYLWGATYSVQDEPITINAFLLATLFSQYGYLFKEEGKFNPHGVVRGPWDAHPMTFTISRLLWRQRDNILKRIQHLCEIPKIEKKISEQKRVLRGKAPPEVGVLVCNPKDKTELLVMLSKNPYHWYLKRV